MGRPKGSIKKIDAEQVRELASIGCTLEEMSRVMRCSESTIKKRPDLREAVDLGSAEMRESLRRMQFRKAREGHVAMLIWLGKQYLGQKDRMEETHKAEVIEIERIAPKILE